MGDHKRERTMSQLAAREFEQKLMINYGHSATHVVVQFTQKVNNLSLSPQQVDAMIDGLKLAKEKFHEYQAAQARNAQATGKAHGNG